MVVEEKESLNALIAAEARKAAVDLLTWCSNQANVDKCHLFAMTLLKSLFFHVK